MRSVDIQKEWEEDIRGNLKRRRERINELKEKVHDLTVEIAKEEEYVAYLEQLLELGPQPARPADADNDESLGKDSDSSPDETQQGAEGKKEPGVNYITVINVKDENEDPKKKVPPKPPPKKPPFRPPPVPEPAPSRYGSVVFDSKQSVEPTKSLEVNDELLEFYREPLDVVREASAKSSGSSVDNDDEVDEEEDPLYDTVAAELLEDDYVDVDKGSKAEVSAGSSPVDYCVDTLRSTGSSNDYNVGTMHSGTSVLSGQSTGTSGTSGTGHSDTEGRGTMSPVHSFGSERQRPIKYEKQQSSPAKLLHQQRRMAYRGGTGTPHSQSGDSDDDGSGSGSGSGVVSGPGASESPRPGSGVIRKSSSIDSCGSIGSSSGRVNSAPKMHQRPLPPVPKARSFSSSMGDVTEASSMVDHPSLDLSSGLFSNNGMEPQSPSSPPPSSAPPLPPPPAGRRAPPIGGTPVLPMYPSRAPPPPPVPMARRSDASKVDEEMSNARRRVVNSVVDTEAMYIECLTLVMQYMKALQATLTTSQPVLSAEDFRAIFFKIPDLLMAHQSFLNELRKPLLNWNHLSCVGEPFNDLVNNLKVYEAFIQNFPIALEVINKCSKENVQFRDLTAAIKVKSLRGQSLSLQEMLHKPVSRIQNHAIVLQDLLNHTPLNHPDRLILSAALKRTQCFLSEIVIVQSGDHPPLYAKDRNAERVLVKNAFIVELQDDNQTRKLRHLFLFSDAIVCAKYKPGPPKAPDKFSFEMKWMIPLCDVVAEDVDGFGATIGAVGGGATSLLAASSSGGSRSALFLDEDSSSLIALKSQASSVRGQILQRQGTRDDSGKVKPSRQVDRLRKKLSELESQLVLASPNLLFRIGNRQGRYHTLTVSSEYDRSQWLDAIKKLRDSSIDGLMLAPTLTVDELQSWMNTTRHNLRDSLSNTLSPSSPLTMAIEGFNAAAAHNEEPPLIGDVNVTVLGLQGLPGAAEVYVCIELDAFGHFFRKATTDTLSVRAGVDPFWGQDFVIELEGSRAMRILLYCLEEIPSDAANFTIPPRPRTKVIGKHIMELNKTSLSDRVDTQERIIPLSADLKLGMKLTFIANEMTLRRAPPGKSCSLFGVKLAHVCESEKRTVPFIVTCCLREVERRGMKETGIYRISGSSSDIIKLRKSFESNQFEAEQVVKTVEIHSVTGLLKQYLRELPEALIPESKYPEFFQAFGRIGRVGAGGRRSMEDNPTDPNTGGGAILQLISELPQQNSDTLRFLLDHLMRINEQEAENKMSFKNLATLFGPTVLRPAANSSSHLQDNGPMSPHPFLNGTIDVMAQAGIFYLLLDYRRRGFIPPSAK